MRTPGWRQIHILLGTVVVAAALVLLAACSGSSDSDSEIPAAGGNPGDVIAPDLVGWTGGVCKAALAFQKSTSSFSDDINRIDLGAPGARKKVLDLYADFATRLKKYKETVTALHAAKTAGGKEVRQLWLDNLQMALDDNAIIVAEVRAVEEASFAEGYLGIITDFHDDFSDQNLRGQLDDLVPMFPAIQSVIDTVDNTRGCAEAAF